MVVELSYTLSFLEVCYRGYCTYGETAALDYVCRIAACLLRSKPKQTLRSNIRPLGFERWPHRPLRPLPRLRSLSVLFHTDCRLRDGLVVLTHGFAEYPHYISNSPTIVYSYEVATHCYRGGALKITHYDDIRKV